MSRLAAVLTAAALAWVAILVVAAAGAAHGTASPFVLLTYEAAGLVCHQRPERSFHLAGVPLAVCARCFGLYASAACGALLAWSGAATVRNVRSRTSRLLLGVAALPTVLTVAGEWLDLVHPSSAMRALAAVPLGAAAGWLIVTLLRVEAARGLADGKS
jgi:uncharacterized membrane protein